MHLSVVLMQVTLASCTACLVMTVMPWPRVFREQGYQPCRITQDSVTVTESMCRPNGSIRMVARSAQNSNYRYHEHNQQSGYRPQRQDH